MKKSLNKGMGLVALTAASFLPLAAQASVDSSLMGLKTVLFSGILPILAAIGVGFTGLQLIYGNPNGKQNFMCAAIGAIIIFLAQSIVDLVSRVVH